MTVGGPWFKTPRAAVLALAFIVMAGLILHRLAVLRPLETLGAKAIQPVTRLLSANANWFNASFPGIGRGRALEAENRRLREENAALLLASEQQRLDRAEAALVHEAQTVLGQRAWTGITARVIGRSADPTFRVYLVNRGTRHGVRPGAGAMVGAGLFVGKVLESDADTAKIILMTDAHATTAGVVENDRRSQGVVTGELGLSLTMDVLIKSDPIQVGQTVVTSGIEDGVPPGLIIGRIAHVDNPPGALFQSAAVTPTAALRNLTVITILTFTNAS